MLFQGLCIGFGGKALLPWILNTTTGTALCMHAACMLPTNSYALAAHAFARSDPRRYPLLVPAPLRAHSSCPLPFAALLILLKNFCLFWEILEQTPASTPPQGTIAIIAG